MLKKINKASSNRFGNGKSANQGQLKGNDKYGQDEEYSMSEEVTGTVTDEASDEESKACEGGNFVLNDFLSYKENSQVLKKFFIFVLLIILSPVILLVMYKYVLTWCFKISKDTCLLISLFFVVVYIMSLTLLYAYLAFSEEEVSDRGSSGRHGKKWR
ncbi:conserved Plasmodium protein, unknown function [Plasmodium knowlesi strain H]|uniref:Uncharacterized protein n=3 Tax=Plasmodium knowlesi TaxID=5850 RepID=A0A5K1VRN5_PLAKH|nr:conserved Plasmodium protein, unknown function [Plasmodium knowlesi strain H]OTN66275.1 Uncharacterized protein PKNOH_S09545400 [Plasmodium knowlesi]CAA9989860.1 conserved Plasmodium protein, unknown function [Plasmodium knowlesi strain H]SBO24415.1 conserved Plasmodium protein, unknown function [Plasmodium knowlesi strain H]SBO26589.1 conserved Plasmodium protein, unknown function [Plasmodium knowlesi strain H]VVS79334.1 conserved Plasmodium protein, unknown function [Plasmodium knowlesi s|eukprot:XP_002259875.1 hypothetical protein, conserved in Plasmodium species [Plasmodium knowlesi strain H]